ncbi:hypothetical protein GIB67_005999 [Kingdonia uniflora]|uniref:Uncharacterized protein n=1 Tax=Kingdonia uniflora TaxID=39325 RepID=A0A7J7MBS5_9MAGN|nr:hypothetical protein GIB67_005999 [Kingdonia uniflora]
MESDLQLHVVMLPWFAFGHMIPFFLLSVALAKAGIRVSFVCTRKNIQRLPRVPSNLEHLLKFVEFQLPAVDGLPEGAEATVDIAIDQIQYLKVSYDRLSEQFKNFISNETPQVIIQDAIPHWTVDIAREFGVRQIMFSVSSSVLLTLLGPIEYLVEGKGLREHWPSAESLTTLHNWVDFPSTLVFSMYEAKDMFAGAFGQNASGFTDVERIALVVGGCEAVAVRSCREFEGKYLDLLEKLYQKPVIPIGLLPPALPPRGKRENTGGDEDKIFKWLDGQKVKSVIFVAFGSEVKLSKDQVHEIAHGLELSKLPFLWVLRKPAWALNDDDESILPLGFLSRTASVGMVHMVWAPQWEILAHPSIGGSLCHCGWGSIVENLQHGHVFVALPSILDHGLNARSLVEKGLAVEVERNLLDGSFKGEDVAKALRKGMVEKEGESIKVRANEMKSMFVKDDYYIGAFVGYLKRDLVVKKGISPP